MEKVVKLLACVAIVALAGCGGGGPDGARGEPDPNNELPFGNVDAPAQNVVVAPAFSLLGWALDDKGVAAIRIYVDNKYKASTTLTADRPDVSKVYPTHAKQSNRHGWTASVKVDQPGPHTLLVQAVDTDGATRDIGVIAINVKQ